MESTLSQEKMIIRFLEEGGSVTSWEASTMFNCLRLSARILSLKKKGYVIKDKWVTLPNKKRVKRYFV